MKRNCWEFKKCGRESGGGNATALGRCPAATETRLHGVHGGKNGGRSCWLIRSTVCGGQEQGSFGEKFKNCQNCDFYKNLRKEEGVDYILSPVLLSRIAPVTRNL